MRFSRSCVNACSSSYRGPRICLASPSHGACAPAVSVRVETRVCTITLFVSRREESRNFELWIFRRRVSRISRSRAKFREKINPANGGEANSSSSSSPTSTMTQDHRPWEKSKMFPRSRYAASVCRACV